MSAQILIVEDEVVIGMNIAASLKRVGYHVDEIVTSGEKALQVCSSTHPDLVLMDINLKGKLNGIITAKQIRELEIPVIFLTSYKDEATIKDAKSALPYGYLLKPFRVQELQTTIEIALHKHQFEKQLKDREFWLNAILQSLWDGVITVDATDDITFLNSTAERLTGWSSVEALGKPYGEILILQEQDILLDTQVFIHQIFEENQGMEVYQENFTLINKGQKQMPIDLHVTYLRGDQDTIIGKVIVLHHHSGHQSLATKTEEHQEAFLNLLTPREQEVLTLIVRGKTTKEIATILYISPRTVEFHRQNIMGKFNVHDTTSLLHLAHMNKLTFLND